MDVCNSSGIYTIRVFTIGIRSFEECIFVMQRYFLYLKYDGAAYHGWQVQPNSRTVQEEVQRALSTLLREDVAVTGAGRTDTGVHARTMVAHFDTDKDVDCAQLVYKLNMLLPRDISAFRGCSCPVMRLSV